MHSGHADNSGKKRLTRVKNHNNKNENELEMESSNRSKDGEGDERGTMYTLLVFSFPYILGGKVT